MAVEDFEDQFEELTVDSTAILMGKFDGRSTNGYHR